MTLTRMLLFIFLTIYLIALGFFIPAINNELAGNNQISYNYTSYTPPHQDESFNLITSISGLPLWFNTIFLLVPFIADIIVGITLFFPTGNAGA
jgi:hypothetical protein